MPTEQEGTKVGSAEATCDGYQPGELMPVTQDDVNEALRLRDVALETFKEARVTRARADDGVAKAYEKLFLFFKDR